jgi:hypothetical protein
MLKVSANSRYLPAIGKEREFADSAHTAQTVNFSDKTRER